MKYPFSISLLLCCVLGWASCTGPVLVEEGQSPEAGQDVPPVLDSVPIIHEGTYASPYTIAEAQTLKRGKDLWVEGYIVGCVSGSMKSGCNFTTDATTASNILLADTFPTGGDYDYLYCFPIRLPDGSFEREDLNLYDNPSNYHRKIRIAGDITQYFFVPGIKEVSDYSFIDAPDESNNPDNPEYPDTPEYPDYPDNPDATRQDTLSIAEGIKLQREYGYEQPYIKGYIIGYTTTNGVVYRDLSKIGEHPKSAKTNVVLADDVKEDSTKNMIAVQLANGSYIQQAVNLVDNPGNLHRTLTVKGFMREHKELHGCTDIPDGLIQGDSIIADYYFHLD